MGVIKVTNPEIKTATVKSIAAVIQNQAGQTPVDWATINQLRVALEAVNAAATA